MKIYLAGPMSGLPKHNFPAFNAATKALRARGHTVFNPAENEPRAACGRCAHAAAPLGTHPCHDCTRSGPQWAHFTPADGVDEFSYFMAIDLPEVCRAEAVVFLPGWADSKGACLEHHVAVVCGKKLFAYAEGPDGNPIMSPL